MLIIGLSLLAIVIGCALMWWGIYCFIVVNDRDRNRKDGDRSDSFSQQRAEIAAQFIKSLEEKKR